MKLFVLFVMIVIAALIAAVRSNQWNYQQLWNRCVDEWKERLRYQSLLEIERGTTDELRRENEAYREVLLRTYGRCPEKILQEKGIRVAPPEVIRI
jgi:hypothetical protein